MLIISFFQEKKPQKSKRTLPVPLTPLIGRQEEVAALSTLLQESRARLVTLWGPGGVGKTRLALEIAAQIADYFPDGVFFIDLAAIRNPAQIIPAVATALGAENNTDPTIQEHLQAHLHGKELLLLLDNFEQVLPASAVLTDLLLANIGLKIMVTSRALLNVRGERGFHVSPLALPESGPQEEPGCVMQSAAVLLFVQRAQEINAHFQITPFNASTIAEICRRLDGLPLAIELAAAHTKLLSAQQLLKQLQNRLQLLTNGARDLSARQQTLQNTLKWSYDLLSPEEQRIFRQCSIFESTCTLEALEAITAETTVTLLERVTALLDKSLLHQSRSANGEPSLRMLGTIREYGWEQLVAHEELESVQHTYMNYYQKLALEAEQKLTGPEQGVWLERLQAEYENLQAVLRLLVEQGKEESTRALGRVLYLFGYIRGGGRLSEELSWLERVTSCGPQTRLSAKARALHCLGASAFFAHDLHQARPLLEESLKLYQEMHEPMGEALAACMLGHASFALQDYPSARAQATHVFTMFKDQTDPIAREEGGHASNLLALIALHEERNQEAYTFAMEAFERFKALKNTGGMAVSLCDMAYASFGLNDLAKAHSLLKEDLKLARQTGSQFLVLSCMELLGVVVARQGRPMWAVMMWGAGETLRKELEKKTPQAWLSQLLLPPPQHESLKMSLSIQHQDDDVALAWARGQQMTVEQVLSLYEQDKHCGELSCRASSHGPDQLTSREVEILRLVATGITDVQIAQQLIISPRTVSWHLSSIYAKIGVSSRSAATRYAIKQHLCSP